MRTDITGAYASQRSKRILSDLHTECRNPCRALSPCHTFLLFSKDQEPQAYVKHLVVLSQSVRDFQQSIAILAHVQLKYNAPQHDRAQGVYRTSYIHQSQVWSDMCPSTSDGYTDLKYLSTSVGEFQRDTVVVPKLLHHL